MFQSKKISLILPAKNEEQNIKQAVQSFKKLSIIDEILVIDNNSTDSTAKIARKLNIKVIRETNPGYGFALQRGMQEAKGDYIVLSEPDGTFDAQDTIKLLSRLNSYDMVTGTRTNPSYIKKGANMGFLLRFGNVFLAKILQILFCTASLSDCGCTLRVIKKSSLKKYKNKCTVGGSWFLVELVILHHLHGGSIKEVPVIYKKRVGVSKITGSKMKAIKVGFMMFLIIMKYRFTSLFSK